MSGGINGSRILQRLEAYFQLSPEPSGLIMPPDPFEQIQESIEIVNGTTVRHAAVLITLTTDNSGGFNDSHVMLTLRTAHLRRHAGQVSLPGGSVNPDDPDIIYTALREAEEETQLRPADVTVLGTLPPLIMPSAFHVTPVVGLIRPGIALSPCPQEVAEIFYVPASILLNPTNYRINHILFRGRERQFWELHHNQYRIWGATAAILRHLAVQLDQLS